MALVALVQPSHGVDRGHIVISQETQDETRYFGFRFDPEDLPAEARSPERWQEYLFSNKVVGYISDELEYVQRMRSLNAKAFLEKRVACTVAIESVLPPRAEWRPFADYSFSPDDFHSDANPCYNCVTWAIMIGDKLVPGFLTPVRQGRIKLIIRQIRRGNKQAGGTNG
jgi:hypothetical protein